VASLASYGWQAMMEVEEVENWKSRKVIAVTATTGGRRTYF
jgi:hypothetical protein